VSIFLQITDRELCFFFDAAGVPPSFKRHEVHHRNQKSVSADLSSGCTAILKNSASSANSGVKGRKSLAGRGAAHHITKLQITKKAIWHCFFFVGWWRSHKERRQSDERGTDERDGCGGWGLCGKTSV
jgi:hypothetical protein